MPAKKGFMHPNARAALKAHASALHDANRERDERIVRAYIWDEFTYEQIARRYGVSRQRVEQIILKRDPTLLKLHRQRRKARGRLRRFVKDTPAIEVGNCKLCGEAFEKNLSRKVFCDAFHHKVYFSYFRFHVDEDYHTRQRLMTSDKESTHYQNLLDGTAETRGRWLVFGSTTWHWAVRAYHLQWPVWFDLPEQIQQQIIDHEGPLSVE